MTHRNLVFVHGKGGVGKSTVAESIALGLAEKGGRVLLVEFEDPTRPAGELLALHPESGMKIWHLNADAALAFEEYAGLKIDQLSHGSLGAVGGALGRLASFGKAGLTQIFTQNKLIKYLAKAAPGIHELVLLGKVWHERNQYDHVIVDLPSTGYGLAMFQSTANFAKLFGGGPVSHDAVAMLETFSDARATGHLIVALPEEMPLQEAIELNGFLQGLFPANPAAFLVNRRFPEAKTSSQATPSSSNPTPDEWTSPYATSVADYVSKRRKLESYNLRLWSQARLSFGEVDYLPPDTSAQAPRPLTTRLSAQLKERGYV